MRKCFTEQAYYVIHIGQYDQPIRNFNIPEEKLRWKRLFRASCPTKIVRQETVSYVVKPSSRAVTGKGSVAPTAGISSGKTGIKRPEIHTPRRMIPKAQLLQDQEFKWGNSWLTRQDQETQARWINKTLMKKADADLDWGASELYLLNEIKKLGRAIYIQQVETRSV